MRRNAAPALSYAPTVRSSGTGAWLLVPLALCVGTLGACVSDDGEDGAEDEEETGAGTCELVDHELWEQIEAAEDPLADHRPQTVECGIAGAFLEFDRYEVDTNFCNYLAVRQPSLGAIEEGQILELGLYHFDLTAPEPAEAHVAMLVEGEIMWERTIPIPGPGSVFDESFASPISAPAGSEVVFHLHNHGQNTWALQHFRLACDD